MLSGCILNNIKKNLLHHFTLLGPTEKMFILPTQITNNTEQKNINEKTGTVFWADLRNSNMGATFSSVISKLVSGCILYNIYLQNEMYNMYDMYFCCTYFPSTGNLSPGKIWLTDIKKCNI